MPAYRKRGADRVQKGMREFSEDNARRLFRNPELIGIDELNEVTVLAKQLEPNLTQAPRHTVDLVFLYRRDCDYEILVLEEKSGLRGSVKCCHQLRSAFYYFMRNWPEWMKSQAADSIDGPGKVYCSTARVYYDIYDRKFGVSNRIRVQIGTIDIEDSGPSFTSFY